MAEIVGHYEILEKLGEGGMGLVYRARDTRLGREVALKLLPERLAVQPAYLQRFKREARAASSLNHPNICTIYEIGEHEGRPFIAMELLEGETVRQLLPHRPLEEDRILALGLEIADALEAAHSKGIIHRDLKPANIFVTRRGGVKILDFGLAKLAAAGEAPDPAAQGDEISPEYLSSPQVAIGTLPYMSPEQALSEELDGRSDLFSLGSVLYEMATGLPAFTGKSHPVLFQQILTRVPAPPNRLNPEISPRLADAICRLLEKDRELRYQTAADLRADFRRIRRDRELARAVPGAPPPPPAEPAPAASGPHRRPWALFRAQARPAGSAPRPETTGRPLPALLSRLRRPKTAALALLALLALALSALYLLPRPVYLPCIEFADFTGGSESVDADVVSFVLGRTLSQFPEISVLDGKEFGHLLRMERARRQSAGAASLLERLPWRERRLEPAVRVGGHVSDSLGQLEIRLDCRIRGRASVQVRRFRGVDDLLNQGIDELARYTLEAYAPAAAERRYRARPRAYRTAVELLSPRWDALRHYHRGARAWESFDMYSAERELRSALEIDPNLALAHLKLGEVRIFQNQWDAAQSEILAARRQSGALTEEDQLRVEAFLARVFGQPFDERVYLQRLIGLRPHKREYLYELAESYFHTADVDEAISRYQDALSLDADYARVYNHLAYCYSWKGEHTRALEACRRYLELDRSANAYDSLGDAHMQAGEYERAREMKSRAIEMDPDIFYAIRNLAFIEMLTGRGDAALERLRSIAGATDDKVQMAQSYAALAYVHYRAGRAAEAREMCRRGLGLLGSVQYDAPHDELVWILGMIEIGRGDLAAARYALGQLRDILDSSSITAMNYKPAYKYWLYLNARILAEEGRRAEAAAAVNDLVWIRDKLGYWSTPYDCAFFFDLIGKIHERMGQEEEAEQAYLDSLSYNPRYAEARLHLAELLQRKGAAEAAQREMSLFWQQWRGAEEDDPLTVAALRASALMGLSRPDAGAQR